jgi:cardiolipin synthase
MIWVLLGTLYNVIELINLVFILVVLLSGKSPARILSWLLVLYFLPIIGFLLYVFFGINWRRRQIVRKLRATSDWLPEATARQGEPQHVQSEEAEKKKSVLTIAQVTTRLPVSIHNRVTPISDTQDIMESLHRDVLSAKHHIHMEFYIWQIDETGKALLLLLVEKAKAGVEVRLIVDGFGSKWFTKRRFLRSIDPQGLVEIVCFQPVRFPFVNLRANYRNHRKLVVIDGRVTYVGGMNIGDEYVGKVARFGYWRDTMLRIEGDATRSAQTIFFQDWHFISKEKLPRSKKYFPDDIGRDLPATIVQVVPSSPHGNWDTMAQLYFEMIASADTSLYITTPYVIPDEALMMALRTAAMGGTDVKLLIPSKPDRWVSYWATQSYLEEMIISGIKVYGYDPTRFIHAKVILVDGVLASIGSANLDQRSMNINFEMNAMVYDRGVVEEMTQTFNEDLLRSQPITLEMIRHRRWDQAFFQAAARLFSPIL